MRRSALVVVVLLGAVIAGALWVRYRSPEVANDSGAAERTAAVTERKQDASAKPKADAVRDPKEQGTTTSQAAVAPSASGPLPAIDIPLASTIEQLRERARAGEPQAVCRLAAEIERCARASELLARSAQHAWAAEQALTGIRDESARERQRQADSARLNTISGQALAEARHCEGVVLESPRETIAYWRQAAAAGNVAALRHYAVGNAFQWRTLVETADLLPGYQAEAEGLARRAASGGDGVALLALINAYSPMQRELSMNFLAQSTSADPVDAVALLRFGLSLVPASDSPYASEMRAGMTRMLDELLPTLNAAQQADAEDRLARYLSEWAPPEAPSKAEMQALQWGSVPPVAPERCSELPRSTP